MSQDRNNQDPVFHRPVLAQEVVDLLAPVLPGVVVDATFGGGGHSRRLLDEFGEDVTVVAIDRDPEALANARELGVLAVQGNFADLQASSEIAVIGVYDHVELWNKTLYVDDRATGDQSYLEVDE